MAKGKKTGGRKPGTPNKATQNAREAFALLVEGNVGRVQGWLDEIAQTDGPKAALQCFLDLTEYHVPKLARTELTGKDGEAITVKTIQHVHEKG